MDRESHTEDADLPATATCDDLEFDAPESPGRLTALASEKVLRKVWDTPEEDEAWRDL